MSPSMPRIGLLPAFALGLLMSCATAVPTTRTSSASAPTPAGDAEFARRLSAGLAASCPLAAASDPQARERCADALARVPALQTKQSYVLWGAQSAPGNYDLSATPTTRFNPVVLRRMYLSTFMFSEAYRLEQLGDRSVVHVPVHFRNALDAGEYPYPFWHSEKKWQSYQQTRELLFVLEAGQLQAVIRSAELDPARPLIAHACDGCLQWSKDQAGRPRAALYSFLFSRDNPHVAALDASYRAFELAQRKANCTGCHDPSNPTHMNPLELFSYPNQALSERHAIVRVLDHNHMPPASEDQPAGIADEAYRSELLRLAREFAAAGDRAFEFDQRSIARVR